jgi:exonuclease SbcC
VSQLETEHASRQSELERAAAAERELERAEAAYREQLALAAAAEASLAERRAVVERAAQAKLEAVEVRSRLAEAGDPAALLAGLEKARADLDAQGERRREVERERALLVAEADELARQALRLREDHEHVEELLEELRREAADMDDPASQARCARCGQALHGEAFSTALRRVRAERDDAERRAGALLARIGEASECEQAKRDYAGSLVLPEEPDAAAYAELVGEINRAREAELEGARLREQLAGLERQIAEVTPALAAEVARLAAALVDRQAALGALTEPEPGALEAAREQTRELQGIVQALAAELTGARAELVRAESALERQHKIAEELATARAEREALLGELEALATCERAYGRDGIPALVVEAQAIPQIEAEANRILGELGTSYRVELRTQRELKGSEGLADTLDVVVIGEVGARPYETFSGGERTRINLALRIALARLLAHRRGADVQLLCVDEPEYLDEAGTARLAEVLRSLEDEFARIVLVSHVPALRDAFDQTLEVAKQNGRSAVVA